MYQVVFHRLQQLPPSLFISAYLDFVYAHTRSSYTKEMFSWYSKQTNSYFWTADHELSMLKQSITLNNHTNTRLCD